MEEIANQIFIEQGYPGVVSSVLKLKWGLLMIDGPYKADDRQAWQQKLINLGGGVGRLIILLDTHTDRLLSSPMVEAPILAQENALEIIQNLPLVPRPSDKLAGSDPEPHDVPQNNRWPLPDITFTQQVSLYWDDQPVVVTHQPGAHLAGSWVRYDAEKVIIVGDSVVINQPPFLAWCQIDRWIEELIWLSSDFFKHYQIVSGRDGVINQQSVLKMIEFLNVVRDVVNDLVRMGNPDDVVVQLAQDLLKYFHFEREMKEQYQSRLVWELSKLVKRIKLEGLQGEINAGA
jgi:glyoxylase-like metal-dependent hydrolase (beta-lactamase superfamily II)